MLPHEPVVGGDELDRMLRVVLAPVELAQQLAPVARDDRQQQARVGGAVDAHVEVGVELDEPLRVGLALGGGERELLERRVHRRQVP